MMVNSMDSSGSRINNMGSGAGQPGDGRVYQMMGGHYRGSTEQRLGDSRNNLGLSADGLNDWGSCGGSYLGDNRGGVYSAGDAGVEGNGWGALFAIVGDNGIESVDGISCILNMTNTAVRIGDGIRSGHNVTVPDFFTGFAVSGFGIGHSVAKLIGRINVDFFNLNPWGNGGNDRGSHWGNDCGG